MTLSRQYIPAIGRRVTLRQFSDYTTLLPSLAVWSHLTVRAVDVATATVTVEHWNARDTGELFTVPLSAIAPPVGWQSRYTIHCKPDQVDQVLSWFARGIVVRRSHDMSGSMPTAFQPMTADGEAPDSPHWQFCELTDAIPAEDCARVFRVVKVEREDIYDVYLVPDSDCPHCKGYGVDSVARVDQYRTERGMTPCDQETIAHLAMRPNWNAESQTFECACVRGGFRKLGRTRRAKLIREWESVGWKTHYVNLDEHSYWERTRETVVRDWEN